MLELTLSQVHHSKPYFMLRFVFSSFHPLRHHSPHICYEYFSRWCFYTTTFSRAAGILFSNFHDQTYTNFQILNSTPSAPYIPGQFYKRELPCILPFLNSFDPDIIIVDGFVWLGKDKRPGLGARLWEELNEKKIIIGVAKSKFQDCEYSSVPILRGQSKNPLWVSSAGVDSIVATDWIKGMGIIDCQNY